MYKKIYPDSGVELTPFLARNYDAVLNVASFGMYAGFIKKAIKKMSVQPEDQILDLGCGTGRNEKLMVNYLSEKGKITGIDLSEIMEKQFNKRFGKDPRIRFVRQRADIPFDLGKQFDKVLISFVIHGFPHEVRLKVLQNVVRHLKPGGKFFILDFAEFDMARMPAFDRLIFKTIECKYAFDFVARDWKKILSEFGFGDFEETLYMKKYARLLTSVKEPENQKQDK